MTNHPLKINANPLCPDIGLYYRHLYLLQLKNSKKANSFKPPIDLFRQMSYTPLIGTKKRHLQSFYNLSNSWRFRTLIGLSGVYVIRFHNTNPKANFVYQDQNPSKYRVISRPIFTDEAYCFISTIMDKVADDLSVLSQYSEEYDTIRTALGTTYSLFSSAGGNNIVWEWNNLEIMPPQQENESFQYESWTTISRSIIVSDYYNSRLPKAVVILHKKLNTQE
jgi:hypothetical protein